jgi:hypothetical protein
MSGLNGSLDENSVAADIGSRLAAMRSRRDRSSHDANMSNTSLLAQTGGSGDDFLLASLVESGFITGSIKTVLERGKQNAFQESLDRFLEKQRQEIQTLCSDNYEEFLKSVSHLKKVRDDAQLLRKKVEDLNKQVQDAGKVALDRGKTLLTFRTIGENVQSASDTVEMCRYVSSLSAKANQQINEQKYYPALITLDELEKSIRNVHRFEFAQFLEKHIPKFKTKIRQCVERDFNDWLVEAKTKSEQIGKLMLEWNEQQEKEPNPLRLNQQYQQYVIHPKTKQSASVFEIVDLKFAPVYTCKHIFETMYLYEQFRGVHYKRNRDIQLRHELDHFPSPSMSSNQDLTNLRTWLERVLGFFAVENAVLHSTSSLLSNVEINSMWERSRLQILTVLSMYFAKERSHKTFLDIKKLVANFCFTILRQLNLDVAPIIEMLVAQRTEFFKILTNDARERCGIQIYKLEPYECYEITKSYPTNFFIEDEEGNTSGSTSPQEVNVPERNRELEQFDLADASMHVNNNVKSKTKQPDKRVLPFSWTLLVCARATERFVTEFIGYRDLILSPSSYCDEVKNGIVELLSFANACMGSVFDAIAPQASQQEDSLSQCAQLVVNLQYMLDRIIPYFDRLYRKLVIHETIRQDEEPRRVLYLTVLFNQVHATLQRGETTILKAITNRCGVILEKSKSVVDWAPVLQNVVATQDQNKKSNTTEPHEFIVEIVDYLKRVDDILKYISFDRRSDNLFFQTFQFIAQYLTDLVTSTRYDEGIPRSLNMISIRNMQRDLRYIMDNLVKQIPAMNKGQHSFTSLIALIDFLIDENVREMSFIDEKALKMLQDAVNDDTIDLDQLGLQSINQQSVQELTTEFCKKYNIANVNSDRVRHFGSFFNMFVYQKIEIIKETANNARASRKKSKKKNFLFGIKR